MPQKLGKAIKAIIVGGRLEARSRLKQALHFEETNGVVDFQSVVIAQSTSEALAIILQGDFDIALVSSGCGREEIKRFVADVSALREDEYTFVAVLAADENEEDDKALCKQLGVTGLLREPYSVETLKGVVALVVETRRKNIERRLKKTIPDIVKQMLEEVEKARQARGAGLKTPESMHLKSSMEKMFADYASIAKPIFYGVLEKVTIKAEPKVIVYHGPSEILKKKYSGESS